MRRPPALARRRWIPLAALLILGCGQGSTTPLPAPTSTASAAAAAGGDRQKALLRCVAARESAQEKLAAAPDEAWAELARGCADVYSAPACRAAWQDAASAPVETRLAGIERACVTAYCPLLPAPKPELCAAPPGDGSLAWSPKWQSFTRHVLAYELGVPEEDLPRGLASPWPDVPLKLPEPAPSATTLVAAIDLALDPGGALVAGIERGGQRRTFPLPASATAQDFAPAVRAAVEPGGEVPRVVIRADRRVPHGAVIGLLDALKQAGVTKIAFGVAPAP